MGSSGPFKCQRPESAVPKARDIPEFQAGKDFGKELAQPLDFIIKEPRLSEVGGGEVAGEQWSRD